MNPVEAGTAMGIMTMAVGPPSNSIPMIFDPVASLALSQDLCALLVRVEGRSGARILNAPYRKGRRLGKERYTSPTGPAFVQS